MPTLRLIYRFFSFVCLLLGFASRFSLVYIHLAVICLICLILLIVFDSIQFRFVSIAKCTHFYNCGLFLRTQQIYIYILCIGSWLTALTSSTSSLKYDIIHLNKTQNNNETKQNKKNRAFRAIVFTIHDFDGVSHVTVKIICYCFDVGLL